MFKTFPEFSKLTLADKEEYEAYVKDFPPISDLSFAGLIVWWNFLDSLAVSKLNENLIISYWLPGDEKNSGLSLVGKTRIDETICHIFDSMREKGESPRLVHVPGDVVKLIRYPGLFTYTAEPDYDDCILPLSALYPLEATLPHRRSAVERFLARTQGHASIRELDLHSQKNQQMLLACSTEGQIRGTMSHIAKIEEEVIPIAIREAEALDIKNVCLYVDNKLKGFAFYQLPSNGEYVISTFIRANATTPGTYEYLLYDAAKHYSEHGVRYINFEQDLGLQEVRAEKLSLGPINFFRKYTIEPT